jgi:hypothetical protein
LRVTGYFVLFIDRIGVQIPVHAEIVGGSMHRVVRRLALAFSLTFAVGATLTPSTASAAAEPCVPGGADWVCLYDNADFTGQFWSQPAVGIFWLAPRFDNRASAVVNASDKDLWLYKDGFDRGDSVRVAPGQRWVAPPDWDKQLTSMFLA